jgi:hypothetical protein
MGNFIGEVTSPVLVNADGNFEIAPGDLLVYTSGSDSVAPASSVAHGASEAADQQAVHDKFLGVAHTTAHADGTPTKLRAALSGVFNMIASGTIQFGSLVGTVTTGTNIESRKVKTVTNKKYAIGTAQSGATDGQNVQVRIASVIFDDGRVAIAS